VGSGVFVIVGQVGAAVVVDEVVVGCIFVLGDGVVEGADVRSLETFDVMVFVLSCLNP